MIDPMTAQLARIQHQERLAAAEADRRQPPSFVGALFVEWLRSRARAGRPTMVEPRTESQERVFAFLERL